MIEFSVFSYERGPIEKVYINPLAVASVQETERRPSDAFWQPVAVILMTTGEEHCVYDHARDAAKKIMEAQRVAANS